MEVTYNKKVNFILKLFWIFFIGSIFGFIVEIFYGLLMDKVLILRKGLLYGPFIQVYGAGAVAYYVLLTYTKKPRKIFLTGMVLGGIIEYIFSFLQEVIFGTISWDYSDLFLNVNGRTSLFYCFLWGLIGIVYLKSIYPLLEKIDKILINKTVRIATYILFAFMIYDITISCIAGVRQDRRKNNIPAKNKIEQYIDYKYPDEYMDKVYINKKEV